MQPHAYRAHDLLWVEADGLRMEGEWPEWRQRDEWTDGGMPVVVRRELVAAGWIPVGLRGLARNQRCAAYASVDAVLRCASPESLAAEQIGGSHIRIAGASSRAAHAIAVLAALAPALSATGLAWGPTGGAGYQLATGVAVLRPDSDLDLVVRAPRPLGAGQAAALERIQRGAACRVDIQIDTGHGAFALAEWGRSRVLLKTGAGPLLCGDPWHPGAVP